MVRYPILLPLVISLSFKTVNCLTCVSMIVYIRGWQTFSYKGPFVNILGFTVSIATAFSAIVA